MKKILLATTALVISAAAADAQAVRIGGQGRMGIMYNSNGYAMWGSDWMQENRLQLNFSVAVQADHGLSFGAFSRVRITNGGTSGGLSGFSGSRVWVEANNLRLTFGNQDGAFRGAGVSHGYLGGCYIGYEEGQQCGDSSPGLNRTQGFASQGGGHPSRLRIDYSFGDTRVALSHDRAPVGGLNHTEFGIRSTFDAFTVALGYGNRGALGNGTLVVGRTVALSGHYNAGTWGAGLIVARLTNGSGVGSVSVTTWALSGNVELGGGNLTAYVGRTAGYVGGTGALTTTTLRAYGLNYGYGLGGGATLTVGAERVGTVTTGSVGVTFNF